MTKKFSGRKKARRVAMQAIYSWQITSSSAEEIDDDFLRQHHDSKFDYPYFQILLHGIISSVEKLDELLLPHINRKISDVSLVDLSILRVACYELSINPEKLPSPIIINEACELAKTYAALDSYKFVNAVLDKVAKNIK